MTVAREFDVLCFGEALVDFFPEKTGVGLEDCDRFQRQLGGAPANVAVCLARQGGRVALMTLVGPDAFGRFVKKALTDEGVDTRGVGIHASAKTGITFVAVAADGARSFLFFRHPSADQMISPAEVDAQLIARARIFHFGSSTLSKEPARSATLRALDEARRAGCVISCDPNWRPHLWDDPDEARALIASVLPRIDILKVSDDELEPLVGVSDVEEGARRLCELGCAVVFVTRGRDGVVVASRAHAAMAIATTPRTAVDSTGAGDAFVAGALSVIGPALGNTSIAALGVDVLRRSADRGNALGGAAVSALGATTGVLRESTMETPS